ncbi:hypothetical protein C8J56DRAFT_342302 [Mycena floridula]|nr:hypothetical protein C8J56DRAFT_342302 [Mycena floridula]
MAQATSLGAELPPELLSLIVDQVEGSSRTLKSCCLVSKAWRKWAQPRVFSKIWISEEADFIRCNSKFERFPHLVSTVTRIVLYSYSDTDSDSEEDEEEEEEEAEGEDEDVDEELLIPFSDNRIAFYHDISDTVRDLTIRNLVISSSVPDLCTIKQLHGLESLNLEYCAISLLDLLNLILLNPNLHSMSFRDILVTTQPWTRGPTTSDTIAICIEKLRVLHHIQPVIVLRPLRTIVLDEPLSDFVALECLMCSLFSLSSLENLTMTWSGTSYGYLNPSPRAASVMGDFLRKAGPSVEELKLEGKLGYFKNDPCFNILRETDCLSYLKSLRKLYLHDTRRNGSCLAIGIIMVHLLPLLNAPCLEEVTLKLELRPSVQKGLDKLSTDPEWAVLDETLSHPRFPAFRRLVVPFTIFEPLFFVARRSELPNRTEEAKIAIANCLPRLSALGYLRLYQGYRQS